MAIGITAITIAATLASAAFALAAARRNKPDSLAPAQDDFQPTFVKQDMAIPIYYGRRRVTGNLIYFGNVISVPIKQKSGGKGLGGGGKQVVGFRRFADVWQAVGVGKLNIIDTIINDEIQPLDASSQQYFDGTNNTTPAFLDKDGNPLEFASPLHGVAHIALFRFFMGDNASNLPTIEYIVEKDLSYLPLANANLPNGNNPAAIWMDAMLVKGYTFADMILTSFTDADQHFADIGYGLNLEFNKVTPLDEIFKTISQYVDVVKIEDGEGRIGIKPLKADDVSVRTIQSEKIKTYSFSRVGWDQVPNDFVGTFIDEQLNFKGDGRRRNNPAAIRLAGRKIGNNVDLKGYRDQETMLKRLTEIRNRESYPGGEHQLVTSQEFSTLTVGDIVTIEKPDFGIVSAQVRITELSIAKIDSNDISIKAVQFKEGIFNDRFQVGQGNIFPDVKQDFTLQPANVAVFELPFISDFTPKYLLLVERQGTFETGYINQISTNASGDYQTISESNDFSLKGQLIADYSGDGSRIDDASFIEFSFTKFDPEFDSIDRDQLTLENRVCIIGDEMLAFQTITLTGTNSARIEGIVRGVYDTPIQNHFQFDDIWITTLGDNIIDPGLAEFFIKALPRFVDNVIEPGLVSEVSVQTQNKAQQPREVGALWATKSGANVIIQFFPSVPGVPGIGDKQVNEPYAPPPFDTTGAKFFIEGDFATVELSSHQENTVVTPGSFPTSITLKTEFRGNITTGVTVNVGTIDRKYKA